MTDLQKQAIRDIVRAAIDQGAQCQKHKSFTAAERGTELRSVYDVMSEQAIALMEIITEEKEDRALLRWPIRLTIRELTREEALAEAWASIDGKLDLFLANKADRSLDRTDGSYPGYIEEAQEMIRRLESRGYTVVPATASTLPAIDDELE